MNLSEAREHFGVREWPERAPLAVRLLRRVSETSEGCWQWQGALADGYGRMQGAQRSGLVLTHRASYELLVGPVPEGLTLDHLCRNRACCNPAHLEPVTRWENTSRSNNVVALNASKTHCKRGHEFTDDNTRMYRGRRFCIACVKQRNAERRSA